MKVTIILVVVAAGWYALNKYILPRFGVKT
jgi:hypothetical protein